MLRRKNATRIAPYLMSYDFKLRPSGFAAAAEGAELSSSLGSKSALPK
jgi:hypothetical protein